MDEMEAYYDDADYSLMADCQEMASLLPGAVHIEARSGSLATSADVGSPSLTDPADGGDDEAARPKRYRSKTSLSAKFELEGFEIPLETVQRQKRVVRRFVNEEERRLRRRATNREAARRTRMRKQHLIGQMETEICKLEGENNLLDEQVTALTAENVSLLAHMAEVGKQSQEVTKENQALFHEYDHLQGITGGVIGTTCINVDCSSGAQPAPSGIAIGSAGGCM